MEQCRAVRRSSGGAGAVTRGGGKKTTADERAPGGSDTGRSEGRTRAGVGRAAGGRPRRGGKKKKGGEKGSWVGWAGFQPRPSCALCLFVFLLKSNQGSNSNRIYSKTWRSLTRLV